MKAGDKIKVYEDPMTQEKLEGEAILKKRLTKDDDSERWLVRFCEDDYCNPCVERLIYK